MKHWLALKNIKAKPLGTLASVIAIAVAVAMFFCMFSFKDAVYNYVFDVETADFGDSDLMIYAKSGGDRIAFVEPLYDVEGVEEVVATVSVYAQAERTGGEDEYVRLRGFGGGDVTALGGVEVAEGDLSLMDVNVDYVVVSRAMAEHFGLRVGDRLSVRGMTSAGRSVNFYVAAVAENTGCFAADSPYTVLGHAERVSSVMISGGTVYNEIVVAASEGTDVGELRERIAAMPEYSALTVAECLDLGYISTRASNLAAPVTIAGAAVALLALVGVVLVFTSGIRARRANAARLALVGATKKRILAVFSIESAVVCVTGAAVGAALAVGVFALMLRIVLSSLSAFSVDGALLVAAAAAGGAAAFVASLYPLVKVFASTARENLHGAPDKGRLVTVLSFVMFALTAVLLIVENVVPGLEGALSAVDLVLVVACAGLAAPLIARLAGKLLTHSRNASVLTAGYAAVRERRVSSASRILAVGMTVSMLLFTAWALTTSVFSGFTAEFRRMILVTNVSSSVDTAEFTAIEGVDGAHLMVWRQADLSAEGQDEHSVNILGSADALDLADFEWITSREDADAALAEGKLVLDYSMRELYGIDVGSSVALTVDGVSREFEVGALVRHNLFNGAYVIVSSEALNAAFGLSPDTVVLTADGDVGEVADEVRSVFADRNYYALPALEAYEWDTKSLGNVFDLIAALAFVLTLLAFAVAVAQVFAGRAHTEGTRSTLLCAGLSKRGLLLAETFAHALSAASAFLFALPVSALAAMCLINALRMFGLYFGFMYNAGAAVAAGLAVAAAYTLVPVVFGFGRGYGMRRS